MPQFAANLMFLFQELDFLDRFDAARAAGFRAVEYQFPYDQPLAETQERLMANGLEMVLINSPPGDWTLGERGLAALPDKRQAFQDSIGEAIGYARELGCRRLHVMSGIPPVDADRDEVMLTCIENLKFAADACAEADILTLVEALNPTDVPGYLIGHAAQARAVLAAAAHPNLYLQYDIYHALMVGEDPREGVAAYLDVIAHMQVAGVPGRHEPSGGDVDYMGVFEFIDTIGYTGWIGCEYAPRDSTLTGLGWASVYGIGN